MSRVSTGFFLHPASARHDTGWGHPEQAGRLRALAQAVGEALPALAGRVVPLEARDATVEELLRAHSREHVDRVRRACEAASSRDGWVVLDPDTVVSGASWEAALGSAGALLAGVEAVVQGRVRNAFVACRPPGHHATRDRAMGFCLFNNVAVAARALTACGAARRVLIVDWDVHHGNGTQDIFYEDPDVFYLSLHQAPHYPGTGWVEEVGAGAGVGATLNVPLPPGTPAAEYRRRFAAALAEATARLTPEFVLVSAGFDVLAGDPLGGQMLEPSDLYAMTVELRALAERACGGRLAVALEGGYNPQRLGAGVVAVLRGLAGVEAPAMRG